MMIRQYEFMIARRFLIKGKIQTLVILIGIAFGVSVQFFLLALIGGLQADLIERTVGASPHVIVLPADVIPVQTWKPEKEIRETRQPTIIKKQEILSWQYYFQYLKNHQEIMAVSPTVEGQGFIIRGDASYAVIVKGIDQAEGPIIYNLEKNLISGRLELAGNSILLGKTMVDNLQLTIGNRVFIQNQQAQGDLFVIAGVFDLGSTVANSIVFINIDRARSFLGLNGISSIEAKVYKIFDADKLADYFSREFSRVKVESWQERNRDLLVALRSQSMSSNIIQLLVVISISLAIAAVLGISAIQKSRQLGILKSMGVDNRGAALIFLLQGLMLGFFGSLLGILLGYGMSYAFIKSRGMATFDLELTLFNLISPVITAILASALASLIPARRASKLSPIEVIRYG
ncbi:MAG: ABC transporter permease [Candidatus Aminicenantales bacterium]